ncbi:hypothetical protein OS175_08860 [Marinicella sp. S1101]|uniref:hypothetical protein n=1 Tax=Marinicella marina TaxID=2996016 RepID=UPI002260D134|nr:hypothetical protein [Marinicella marina]MCX7553986.1 hypothetical protein [Marinicella marina]MDJ1140478.1 hypothetical protein [Marinicella marina]
MKTFYTLLILFISCNVLAQNNINLEVLYVGAEDGTVTTEQQGTMRITVTNSTNQDIGVRLNKSFNYYTNLNTSPRVAVDNPSEPQITDICLWGTGAYSPWPAWTDGYFQYITIDQIPAMSSVTCEGEYTIGLVGDEQHTVEWSLILAADNTVLASQANTFSLGPIPLPAQVPTIEFFSKLLLAVLIFIVGCLVTKRKQQNALQVYS